MDCFINSFVINSIIQQSSQSFTAPLREKERFEYGASSHQIDYVILKKTFIHPEGHHNWIIGSKVMIIVLKWWILSIGGVALGRVCEQRIYHV